MSDTIYFTYYEDMMINKEIFELSETCRKVDVPKRILDFTDRSVVGYQVDSMICKYFFDKGDIYELFADRMWGELLFYRGEHRIAYIYEDDWGNDVCIKTDDKQLIKEVLHEER